VQVLNHAGVNFAVLGKKECCTGDSARRAGNEVLYQALAGENILTLNECAPKLIIATCPHCMNALGKEYPQLGGNYAVMHHTEYLELLTQQGKLMVPAMREKAITFHDPCYLGRHNDVYDAPRNLLHILSNDVRELERNREKSFCCGAGGAQFWKEEEAGTEKISENRFREASQVLAAGSEEKVLAVGCPFCKSMLQSTIRDESQVPIAVMDVAELIWESISTTVATPVVADLIQVKKVLVDGDAGTPRLDEPQHPTSSADREETAASPASASDPVKRLKWVPKAKTASSQASAQADTVPEKNADEGPIALTSPQPEPEVTPPPARKKWTGKSST
jgi:hypothetical protein